MPLLYNPPSPEEKLVNVLGILPDTKPGDKLYGIHNRRELAVIEESYINIDETKLDLFDYYKNPIPDYKPKNYNIKKYPDLQVLHLDIETTGGIIPGSRKIDADNHQITLIGLKNERGQSMILDALTDEYHALSMFIELLNIKKPDILNVYNGFFFDIRFIIRRCEILGIEHPFWVPLDEDGNPSIKRRSTCQINSKITEYTPVWLSLNNDDGTRHHCAIIDSFHEVLAWDFVKRSLVGYRLKEVPVQMGLTDEEVIDLEYSEMLECYENWEEWGREKMSKYLESDLSLTKKLGDYLFPSIYYQKIFLDWKLQSLAGSGNGSKWNCLIKDSYPVSFVYDENIFSDEKMFYKGAYTLALAGLYGGLKFCKKRKKKVKKEVCKIDVASLYPTVMLLYGICSSKDIEKFQLAILKYLRNERLILKALAEENQDSEADQMQGVMKILINSGYGSLGTKGIEFNDYIAAALVTAYARGIFRIMLNAGLEFGANVCSMDTDGAIFEVDEGQSRALCDYIQDRLPGKGTEYPVKLELEWVAKNVFVPESDNQSSIDVTLIDPDNMGYVRAGLKKNYIIVMKEKKNKEGKVIIPENKLKFNGKYRKRDRNILEKSTQPELVKLIATDGVTAARKYYRDLLKSLNNKTYDVNKLKITRKIRKGEKNLIRQGIGQENDIVTIWKSHDTYEIGKRGLPTKKVDINGWTKDPKSDNINWDFYIEKVKKMFSEVIKYCEE